MIPSRLIDFCDAIELLAISSSQAKISPQVVANEFNVPISGQWTQADVESIFQFSARRAGLCSGLYPFDVSQFQIYSTWDEASFSPYIFLLLGSNLELYLGKDSAEIKRLFRRYFEDFVAYIFDRILSGANVLSTPREERGLPRELPAALKVIALKYSEPATLDESRIKPEDNDLGADVLGWMMGKDGERTGVPIFAVQCSTSRGMSAPAINAKVSEKSSLFSDVWQDGFYSSHIIKTFATSEDLLTTVPLDWRRWCNERWMLDRCRIISLAAEKVVPFDDGIPSMIQDLWNTMLDVRADFDFRSGW